MCGPVFDHAIEAVNAGVIDDALAPAVSELLANKDVSAEWFSVFACAARRLLELGGDPAQMRVNDRGGAPQLLKRCAERPIEGLDALVPVVVALAEAGGEAAGRLEAWTSPFLIEDHVGYVVVAGIRACLRSAAVESSDTVKRLCRELWAREERTSWLLALSGVAALLEASTAEEQLVNSVLSGAADRGLLLEGPRELREAALEVVARTGTLLNEDVRQDLERRAVEHRASAEDGRYGPERAQRLAMEVLQALGKARLGERGRRRLQELERRFPGAVEQGPTPDSPSVDQSHRRIRTIGFGSPIDEGATAHMTDDQWLGAMAKYVDDQSTGPLMDGKGGAWQLAGVLGKVAKQDPRRFIGLLPRIPTNANPAYRNAIVRACGESELLSPEDVDAVLPAVTLALEDERLLRAGCEVVERRPDWEWAEEVIARIVDLATEHPDEGMDTYSAPSNYAGSGSPLGAGRTSVAGQAAIALVNYWANHAEHIEQNVGTVEVLTQRAVPVRAYAAVMCLQLRGRCGDDVALPIFLAMCEHDDDRLLGTAHVVQFIYRLQPKHLGDVLPLLARMCGAADERTAREGAAQTALFVAKGASDLDTLRLLEQCRGSSNPVLRRGVAQVLSKNIDHVAEHEQDLRPAWESWLVGFFDDADDDVRQQATHWIHELTGETVMTHMGLVRAFIESPAVLDGMRLRSLAKTLREAPGRIHEPVRWLLDRVRAVPELSEEAAKLEQALMWLGEDLAGLVIRALEHTEDEDQEWLDDLDWLAKKDARKLEEELAHHDR